MTYVSQSLFYDIDLQAMVKATDGFWVTSQVWCLILRIFSWTEASPSLTITRATAINGYK